MTFQQIPDCVEVVLKTLVTGVPVINRWYVQAVGGVDETFMDDVAAAIDGWVTASLSNIQCNEMLYQNIVIKNMDVENGLEKIYDVTTVGGAVTTRQTPNNAAIVISWRTPLTGRNYRGRTYLGSVPVSVTEDATHISSAAATAYAGVAEDLVDAIDAAGGVLVVVSKVLAGVQRVIAAVNAVITIIVNTTIDSQARRTAN